MTITSPSDTGTTGQFGATIQEVARSTGFSEPTLRYYERIGLIGPVPRDDSSGHRRYPPDLVDRLGALACLRATGMSIDGLRRYLAGTEGGRAAASEMVALFSAHAAALDDEMRAVRLRHAYITAKQALWQARVDGDRGAEVDAATRARHFADQLRGARAPR